MVGVVVASPLAWGAIEGCPPRLAAAVCVAIFAFFFVTVSSRIVGLVGVTSNPTSGMTIAALLGGFVLFVIASYLPWFENVMPAHPSSTEVLPDGTNAASTATFHNPFDGFRIVTISSPTGSLSVCGLRHSSPLQSST